VLPTTRLVDAIRRRSGGRNGGHRPDDGAPTTAERGRDALTASIRRRALGGVRATLRLGNRLAEEWYRQGIAWLHVRRGRVVLFDRHFFSDYWATDIAARQPSLARRLHGFVLRRVYPKPDLVIYLDAPAEVLFARKGEGTIESLERKRAEYLALGRQLPHFVVVSAVAPQDDVAAATRGAIVEFAASRFPGAVTVPRPDEMTDGAATSGPEARSGVPEEAAAR
jgi:thymidylate kinase